MINYRTAAFISLSMALLHGCASSSNQLNDSARLAQQLEQQKAEQVKQYKKAEQQRLESELSAVPAWALSPPQADSTGIYAVGIADSKKLQTVIRKARLEAEFELAKQYNQEISGSERAYEQDNGGEQITEQYTALIDKLVDRIPVKGFSVIKQDVAVLDGRYHAYILLKLPYDEFNAVLQQEKIAEKDSKIKAAFNELEVRLQQRRAERIEDDQRKFTQEMEASEQAHKQSIEAAALDKAPEPGPEVGESDATGMDAVEAPSTGVNIKLL